jgi:hypothetical protein
MALLAIRVTRTILEWSPLVIVLDSAMESNEIGYKVDVLLGILTEILTLNITKNLSFLLK